MPSATPTTTSTLLKTRRFFRDLAAATASRLRGAAVGGLTAAAVTVSAAPLACSLTGPARVPVGQPVTLQFTLSNTGTQALHVLVWGTPFESGWFTPYVAVRFGSQPLAYGGPSVKRGDPQLTDYVHLAPGQSRQADVQVSLVFDLRKPGRYHVQPQIQLHDVVVAGQGTVPRPRSEHLGQALACPALKFIIGP